MEWKRRAAEAAVDRVKDGMVLGLGTGSTVRYAIERLGRRVAEGWELAGVPTSRATAELARELQIPLTTLDEHPSLDLTIDGADEVDPRLDLIKGLGGALLREKIVAAASEAFLIVVDEGKVVEGLGERAPLPVEVLPFGARRTRSRLEALGCEPT
ncbi:MAG: ribose-5-phosphate isomerase RpiA, partial [Thermoplasmata archaeon]